LEYIQCPHCQKKYGVNEKVRAASGKTIKCKACKEPFEIVIFSTPAPQTTEQEKDVKSETPQTTDSDTPLSNDAESASSDPEEASASNAPEQAESDDEPSSKKEKKEDDSNPKPLQLVYAGLLSLVLIAGLLFAYQLMTAPKTTAPIKSSAPVARMTPALPEIAQPSQDEAKGNKESEEAASSREATADEPSALPELDMSGDMLQREAEKILQEELLQDDPVPQPEVPGEEATAKQPMDQAAEQSEPQPGETEAVETQPEAIDDPVDESISETSVAENSGQNETADRIKTLLDPDIGPEEASDKCKQVAADQWMIDYMITHGNVTGDEYIRLLDESSNKTEEVRSLCQSKYLAGNIAEAAKKNMKPAWIRPEIDARTTAGKSTGIKREW